MSDRRLGYLILFMLLACVLTIFVLLQWVTLNHVHKREILFSKVGNLSIDDPVRVHGVLVGTVHEIKNTGDTVLVSIYTKQPLVIHKGYYVEIAVKGIMGDRYISVDPGDTSAPVIGEKEALNGRFFTGPSEALAYMYKLRETVSMLKDLSTRLRFGNGRKQSIIKQFGTFTHKTDSIVTALNVIAVRFDQELTQSIDTFSLILNRALSFSNDMSEAIPGTIRALAAVTGKADSMVALIERAEVQIGSFVEKANSPDALIWKGYIADLDRQIEGIRRVLLDIKEDGLNLPVRPK